VLGYILAVDMSQRGTIDGRTARRDRNRLAVLDAVLELFAVGDLNPSPEAVAHRSGLSLRSVYRYVADSDDLIHAAFDRQLDRVRPLLTIDAIGQGPFEARVEAFAAARLRLHEAVAGTARAAELKATTSEIVRDRLLARRYLLRAQLERHFAPEIAALSDCEQPAGQSGPESGAVGQRPGGAAAAAVAAADALTQIETIGWYRGRGGYSQEQTHAALVIALRRLLGQSRS
jgi:AcrR family transcriptional regulator